MKYLEIPKKHTSLNGIFLTAKSRYQLYLDQSEARDLCEELQTLIAEWDIKSDSDKEVEMAVAEYGKDIDDLPEMIQKKIRKQVYTKT